MLEHDDKVRKQNTKPREGSVVVVGDATRGKGPVESVAGDPPPVTIPMPAYRYVDRLMAQQTFLSDVEYQELRRTAWRKELAENYWGSAHQAPRYLARIE